MCVCVGGGGGGECVSVSVCVWGVGMREVQVYMYGKYLVSIHVSTLTSADYFRFSAQVSHNILSVRNKQTLLIPNMNPITAEEAI